MQVMGANGLKQDWPLARFFAHAKIAQFLDGTTEIQNVVISRALLAPYRGRGIFNAAGGSTGNLATGAR